jgi:hypothetical protein
LVWSAHGLRIQPPKSKPPGTSLIAATTGLLSDPDQRRNLLIYGVGNDQVCQISGIRVRETVPDRVVQQADEVVMVDLTPRALLIRLQRGVVYSREKAERALQNFFREQTRVALRELALRQAAHEVCFTPLIHIMIEWVRHQPAQARRMGEVYSGRA